MGEYYDWVNVDKKEYITPNDFDYGNKSIESCSRGNEFLCALRELLHNEWAGDHIFFMGDEKNIPEDTKNETLKLMYNRTVEFGYPGCPFDTEMEYFKNVGGLFKKAEKEVSTEIGFYLHHLEENDDPYLVNEYDIDVSDPYKGLFTREGRDFKYTINHTKKVYYAFGMTKILYHDNTESDTVDPLPILMAYGRASDTGDWVGDIIGVSDEKPEGYILMDHIYLSW